jgi:hypothetical protein
MKRYENELFMRAVVVLDEAAYIDCRFEGCTFRYGGGPYELTRCTVVEGGKVQYEGAAQRTLEVMRYFEQES